MIIESKQTGLRQILTKEQWQRLKEIGIQKKFRIISKDDLVEDEIIDVEVIELLKTRPVTWRDKIKQIEESKDIDFVESCLDDKRKSVINAAENKLKILKQE